MTPVRHLARAATLFLVAPLVAVTMAALPAPAATASVAVQVPGLQSVAASTDADGDGDGVPDTVDGCPTVAAVTPTGCPAASRQASLRWVKADKRLEARISSPVTACSARARIVLWRVRPHSDFKIAAVSASSGGRHRFTVTRGASYYVTVSPSYSPGRAECAKATSRTVLAPRG